MSVESLAQIFSGLAQALADPESEDFPRWIASPGKDWPLFPAAVNLAASSPHPEWGQVVTELAELPAGSLDTRKHEYTAVFDVSADKPIWLYESRHTGGRFLGPKTFTLKALYSSVGLEVAGAELPDHASLELAFLAFLAGREIVDRKQSAQWRAARRLFIRNHAGRWLPRVGRELARSPYPHWVVIGQLITASLHCERPVRRKMCLVFPVIREASRCNLCSFCVQVCPTEALRIHEDDAATAMWLAEKHCVHCQKCERVCPQNAISMEGGFPGHELVLLRTSPLARCPACGAPVASQAELDEVCRQLGGSAVWVRYCLDCRINLEVQV